MPEQGREDSNAPMNRRASLDRRARRRASRVALSPRTAPDRSKPPAIGPAAALKLPTIEKRQLANGLPVWIVELHEVPVVQVNLSSERAPRTIRAGKFGVASLTAAMLNEGAGSRSSLEIADAVDFLGADLSARAASTPLPCGCMCRWRASPKRCRSWPTSRFGRRFPRTSSNASGSSG